MKVNQAIIFDLDGVIIDSEYEYLKILHKFLKNEGLNITIDRLYPLVGMSWTMHYQYLEQLYKSNITASEIQKRYNEYEKNIQYNYQNWIKNNTYKTLKKLKQNYHL